MENGGSADFDWSDEVKFFNNETLAALLLAVLILLLVIFTAGDAPQWIYQGF